MRATECAGKQELALDIGCPHAHRPHPPRRLALVATGMPACLLYCLSRLQHCSRGLTHQHMHLHKRTVENADVLVCDSRAQSKERGEFQHLFRDSGALPLPLALLPRLACGPCLLTGMPSAAANERKRGRDGRGELDLAVTCAARLSRYM